MSLLLEKVEQSEHPEAVRSWASISRPLGVPTLFFLRTQRLCDRGASPQDSYVQQLCCLMLIGPLAAPVEAWLIERSRTSLHYSLQVYWFCQVREPRGLRTLLDASRSLP